MAKFSEQLESDRLIEDIEILTELQRERFHVRPEEDGASIFGPLELREHMRRETERYTVRMMWARLDIQFPST